MGGSYFPDDNVAMLFIIRNYLKIARFLCPQSGRQNTAQHTPQWLVKIHSSVEYLITPECLVNQAANGQDSLGAITAPTGEVSSHLAGLLSSLPTATKGILES